MVWRLVLSAVDFAQLWICVHLDRSMGGVAAWMITSGGLAAAELPEVSE